MDGSRGLVNPPAPAKLGDSHEVVAVAVQQQTGVQPNWIVVAVCDTSDGANAPAPLTLLGFEWDCTDEVCGNASSCCAMASVCPTIDSPQDYARCSNDAGFSSPTAGQYMIAMHQPLYWQGLESGPSLSTGDDLDGYCRPHHHCSTSGFGNTPVCFNYYAYRTIMDSQDTETTATMKHASIMKLSGTTLVLGLVVSQISDLSETNDSVTPVFTSPKDLKGSSDDPPASTVLVCRYYAGQSSNPIGSEVPSPSDFSQDTNYTAMCTGTNSKGDSVLRFEEWSYPWGVNTNPSTGDMTFDTIEYEGCMNAMSYGAPVHRQHGLREPRGVQQSVPSGRDSGR